MDYGMIGQIAKAKHYAEERHRIHFTSFEVILNGNNNPHTVKYNGTGWECDSSFFQAHGWSSHTIALERILQGMVTPVDTDTGKDLPSQSSMISQIEKAKRYTDEPERIRFIRFTATFQGENNTHIVSYHNGKWDCTSNFFKSHGWDSHTLALERILVGMVTPTSAEPDHAPTDALQ